MSDPALGLLMLTLIVVVIMMGFATAFTLMGLGIIFGFIAFYDPTQAWTHNKVFDLMVQRTYGAMPAACSSSNIGASWATAGSSTRRRRSVMPSCSIGRKGLSRRTGASISA